MDTRFHGFLAAFLLVAAAAAQQFEQASVTAMTTVPCAGAESSVLGPMGVELATPPECREYVIEAGRVRYVVQSRDHRQLLPVGEIVLIKLTRREMLVRTPLSEKNVRFVVMEMTLLETARSGETKPGPEETAEEPQAALPSRRTCLTRDGEAAPCVRP